MSQERPTMTPELRRLFDSCSGTSSRPAGCGCLKLLFLVLVVGAIVTGVLYYEYGTVDHITITVDNKDRVIAPDAESSTYLVWTDKGEFKVSDSLFHGKIFASKTYGKLHVGGTYRVKINGMRWGFPTLYPNILEVEDTSSDAAQDSNSG